MSGRLHFVLGAILVSAAAFALFGAPFSAGLENGISGRAQSGCTCHGSSPTAAVTPGIQGLPAAYVSGTTYSLTVSVAGGPHVGGGFDLLVSAGTLAPDGPNVQAFSATEAGHTNSDATSWRVKWTAPASGAAVNFFLAANSVNKDGTENGDQWNKLALTLPGPAGTPAGAAGAEGISPVVWLALAPFATAALLAALAYLRPAASIPPEARAAPGRVRSPLLQLLVLTAAFGLTFAVAGAGTLYGGQGGGGVPAGPPPEPESHQLTGYSNVSQAVNSTVTLDGGAPASVVVDLTWTDEPNQARHQNQPDTFRVEVATAGLSASATATNPQGGTGEAVATLDLKGAEAGSDPSNVTVTVTCVSAGSQKADLSILGLRDRVDAGNAWTATVSANFSGGSTPRPAGASNVAHSPMEHAPYGGHAIAESVAVTLSGAAFASAFALRGWIPPALVPARLRPSRLRHAVLGVVAVTAVLAAALLGIATALGEGGPFEPHGLVGIALLGLAAAQAALGYMTFRGKPMKRLHGLSGSALMGALLGTAAAGLLMFLGG